MKRHRPSHGVRGAAGREGCCEGNGACIKSTGQTDMRRRLTLAVHVHYQGRVRVVDDSTGVAVRKVERRGATISDNHG